MVMKVWNRNINIQFTHFENYSPKNLYLCQWQTDSKVSVGYLIYRWITALAFISIGLYSVYEFGTYGHPNPPNRFKWTIYLTHWGFTLCILQSILGTIVVTQRYVIERKQSGDDSVEEINLLYKVYWSIQSTSTVIAIGITILYWTIVYNKEEHVLSVSNILMHVMNSVMMLIDLFLVSQPMRLIHCRWPFAFGCIYVVFSAVYFLAGGTDRKGDHRIYNVLDWKNVGKSLIIVAFCLIFIICLYFVTYCLFLLRRLIYIKIRKTKEFPPNSLPLALKKHLALSEVTTEADNNYEQRGSYSNRGVISDLVV